VLVVAGLAVGAALIVLLQLVPPTNAISPIRRTISEYALGSNRWIFNLAVALIALASAAGFSTLIRQRRLAVYSAASAFAAVWTISLLVIVVFPKTNWAVGPSAGGPYIASRAWWQPSCLPIAILFASRTAFLGLPGRRRSACGLAVASLLWFGVILGAIGVSMTGGGPWWQLIPLGLVERLMALTELLAIGALVLPIRLDMTQVTDQAGRLRVLS
jgi:hypothetical protein